ncbi:MAG: hypothetical protein ABH879_07965 [archaeon]
MRAALSDIGGVLPDSSPLYLRAWRETLSGLNIPSVIEESVCTGNHQTRPALCGA